mgnify:CR=1 FL=1
MSIRDILHDVRKTVGVRQTVKAVRRGELERVFAARDADPAVMRDLLDLCAANGVEVVWVDTMKELGEACGIEVGASSCGLFRG